MFLQETRLFAPGYAGMPLSRYCHTDVTGQAVPFTELSSEHVVLGPLILPDSWSPADPVLCCIFQDV